MLEKIWHCSGNVVEKSTKNTSIMSLSSYISPVDELVVHSLSPETSLSLEVSSTDAVCLNSDIKFSPAVFDEDEFISTYNTFKNLTTTSTNAILDGIDQKSKVSTITTTVRVDSAKLLSPQIKIKVTASESSAKSSTSYGRTNILSFSEVEAVAKKNQKDAAVSFCILYKYIIDSRMLFTFIIFFEGLMIYIYIYIYIYYRRIEC